MATKTAKIGAALFRYTDPKSKGRRWARTGDTVELLEKDYERLERGGGLFQQAQEAADDSKAAQYDQLKVKDAIVFLEQVPEDQREPYFEQERKLKRKGVLAHFDQPTE